MEVASATMDWQIMKHPPYNPDLAHSDIHLFAPGNVVGGGQKF
jgi:hypothetical protein